MAVKAPCLSIVMPAFNSEQTIQATIKSIQAQTYTDFELIIVNDGSTDRTKEYIQGANVHDPRIQSYTIPNNGPGNARNVGIQHAKGTYLLLIDADDQLAPETLSTYMTHMSKMPVDLIVSSYESIIMDGSEILGTRQTIAPAHMYTSNAEFISGLYALMEKQLMYVVWNKVYRLDIIKEHGVLFPPYKSCEDRLFNLAYYAHVQTCITTEEILYHYKFDGKNSLTNQYLPNKFETFLEFYEVVKALTDEHLEGYSALFLKGVMSCLVSIHGTNSPLTSKQKKAYIKRVVTHPLVQEASEKSATDSAIRVIIKRSFQSQVVWINALVSKSIYRVSTLSPRLIEKLKSMF